MNWNAIEQGWRSFAGSAKKRWDKFSDEDLRAIAGKRDVLIQKLKEKYGISHEQAEKEVDDFHQSHSGGGAPETRTSGGGR